MPLTMRGSFKMPLMGSWLMLTVRQTQISSSCWTWQTRWIVNSSPAINRRRRRLQALRSQVTQLALALTPGLSLRELTRRQAWQMAQQLRWRPTFLISATSRQVGRLQRHPQGAQRPDAQPNGGYQARCVYHRRAARVARLRPTPAFLICTLTFSFACLLRAVARLFATRSRSAVLC